MKVSLSTQAPAVQPGKGAELGGAPRTGQGFTEVLKQQRVDLHQQLTVMRNELMSGKQFSPRELLAYQVTAQNFSVHLELVSKCAEAVNSGMKRLQSPG